MKKSAITLTLSIIILGGAAMALSSCSSKGNQGETKVSSDQISSSSTSKSSSASSKEESSSSASSSTSSSNDSSANAANPPENQIRMNLAELAEGNYSSVRGTWQNDQGHRLTFDEKGLVSDSYEFYGASLTDYGTAAGGVYGGESGGFLIEFIPAGVSLAATTYFTDNSDPGRDRLWTGVGIKSFDEQGSFYYRV